MTDTSCDCKPWPGRIDADGRCFTCSGDLAHVKERIARYLASKGTKPASAEEMAAELADRLFDHEAFPA